MNPRFAVKGKPGLNWPEIKKSGSSVEAFAPAKLNLFLEVLGKREDGFHELETVMVAINRFDRIRITLRKDEQVNLSCRWSDRIPDPIRQDRSLFGELPVEEDNLVLQAVRLFQKNTGLKAGLEIDVEKLIPLQAGLGGASSDAAVTLLALDSLVGANLSRIRLLDWAAELGSDVPFFIESRYAVCEGRGEQITQINNRPDLDLVVVKPPFGLSTREVFTGIKMTSVRKKIDRDLLMQGRTDWTCNLFNRLQERAGQMMPEIVDLCGRLEALGCLASLMTGSGSCCFGICRDLRQAEQIAQQVNDEGTGFAFSCQNL